MELGDVIYSWNRLEPGKRYIAYSFDRPTVPLWQGCIVTKAYNGDLLVVEQPDGTLAVVWASNFPEGVSSIYHEVIEGPVPRVPLLSLPASQARDAARILLQRTDAEQTDEPYTALFYPCIDGDGWHYTETPDQVLDVAELRHYIGESGKTLALVTRSLMERAGMLCEHTSSS